MTNKKRYISNIKSRMDTKIDLIVADDMEATHKNHITLCKNIFPFMNFFFCLRIVPISLHRATTRLLLLVREKVLLVLTFLNLYVTLNEIHGSIW